MVDVVLGADGFESERFPAHGEALAPAALGEDEIPGIEILAEEVHLATFRNPLEVNFSDTPSKRERDRTETAMEPEWNLDP